MEKARDMLTIGQKQNYITENFVNVLTTPEINISIAPISLIHVFNSLGSVNMLIISYNTRAPYINVVLKEYPYLSLYNSNRHNDAYEFKNSGLCPGYEKEHNKEKVIS